MPTYTFKNVKTEEVFDKFVSISEMERMVESGEVVQIIGSPLIVDGVGELHGKIDDGFKEVLQKIASGRGKNHKMNI
jgi:hypothetical protein